MFNHLILKENKEEFYTKQTYENSCAAFAGSVLFCNLLKKAGQAINPKMQFIFETNMYPLVWSAPGEGAGEKECFKFLEPFVSQQIGSYLISDADDIAKIKPAPEEVLFCQIVRSADDHRHVIFACSVIKNEKTCFLTMNNEAKKQHQLLNELPKEIKQILKIPLVDFQVDKIKSWYEQIQAKTPATVFEYTAVFLKTLDNAVTFCCHFPESREKVAEYVLSHGQELMTTMSDVDKFCQSFPKQRESAAQFVVDNGDVFLRASSDVLNFLVGFPKFKSQVVDYLIENGQTLLGQDVAVINVCHALEDVPDVKKKLLQHVLASDYLSAMAKRGIRKTFAADLSAPSGAVPKPQTDFFKGKSEDLMAQPEIPKAPGSKFENKQ